jgi:dynein heavy chain 2, cytosolic
VPLLQEAEAFGQDDGGGFEALDAVEADIAAAKKAWSRYSEFIAERDELAHRDWLSMRDQASPCEIRQVPTACRC